MVVVTGATGHIGNALVRQLIAEGQKVRALVMLFEDIGPIKSLDVEIRYGDVRDMNSLVEAFKGAEYVYHLAGIVSISTGKRRLLQAVNVIGTKNVVEACIRQHVRRLVYVSSIHAFEEPPHGTPIVETKEFDPSRVSGQYAKSKAAATLQVLHGIEKGLDAVIVHPTGVIGPYEYKLSNIGQLVVDYMNGRLLAYINGAYDFVDVRDVAQGIIQACKKGRKGENYILSGEQISVRGILDALESETGIKAPRSRIPLWFAKMTGPFSELYYKIKKQQPLYTSYSIRTLSSNSLASHEKASRELGFFARSIRESIKDTVKWFNDLKFNIKAPNS